MPVYHIVLFKLKPEAGPEKIQEFEAMAKGMVGKIPGLREMAVAPPLESTAHRGQGFNLGLVATLEKASDVKIYAEHPVHQQVHKFREEMATDTLAYDLVF
ncbi:hypothetical protein BDY17DRAFT_302428 [Neohortaea acidophila]|uniref:Stress-response A/B barrel domain-containing protein n=1 Tax=Neohortaea acidophila TaxID=245834 RepID=A0A6A6PL56_9PEZI|nr:uncharacterized protein BDY17DRAFT_302428 [Neohortaea acidophila]KAF2480808.1 hypothetical protein BDY17DRAFT_302428 [Neohortaea acidophila]